MNNTMSASSPRKMNGHNPFDNPRVAQKMAVEREADVRDDRDQRAADQYRARDLTSAADRATADEASSDLRKVMADNADVLTSSDILAHIARFAEGRSAERYGVLFGVAMRAVGAVPPPVVLPPIIGGEVSLNLLTANVGSSGGGKGTIDKTAAAAVRLMIGGRRPAPVLSMVPIGTGEGINRTYARVEKNLGLRWSTDTALFSCRDIATLDALISRQGATLMPELLKAYMGEELGFANADKERRVILPMHSYRLCLSAGVQPDNGAVLLGEQMQRDGVPQRFLWTPVRPGHARKRRSADDTAVDPLTVPVPDFGIDPYAAGLDDDEADLTNPAARALVPMDVETDIAQQIIDADAAKDLDPFGRSADPLAGHRLLAQLKLAAALAVLHNRTGVGAEDWQRAERLLAVSAAVAQVVAVCSGAAAERDAARRGQLDGHRLAAADDARNTATLQRLMNRVTRYLGKQTDWVAQGAVTCSVTGKLRRDLPDALAALVAGGIIERRTVERTGQNVVQFRMSAA